MRVLVATDSIGSLSSARAGALLATGWPAADVTVVALGEAGVGFAAAAAAQLEAELVTGLLDDRVVSVAHRDATTVVAMETADSVASAAMPDEASSVDLGRAVGYALAGPERTRRLLVDLSGACVHDGGSGFLAALGATADVALDRGVAGLGGLSTVDLSAVRDRLAGIELVGVVGADQIHRSLLGLRGITSLRAREAGVDQAQLLATDATLSTWAHLVAPAQANVVGAGACGGVGFAILALGGRLVTGPQLAFEHEAAGRVVAATDLVVTGCTVFDFARRGGGVVAEAARVATSRLSPCIAVAAEVLIGGREMRTMGIESAYPVREPTVASPHGGDVSEAELMATARRIGRSWRW